MSDSLFSPHWYRVAALRPRLRAHAKLERHLARGERWAVLRDPASGRQHRISATAWEIAGRCDGRRSMQTIWEAACERLGDDAPTQDETIEILAQLHAADLLQSDVTPDAAELFERHAERERRQRIGRFANPLAIRVPLLSPDPWLTPLLPLARFLFTRRVLVLWLVLIAGATLLAAGHWVELSANALDRALTAQNLLMIALLFPAIKLLHETGHALATRAFGGEVREAGVLLLALFPLPYVDASSSAGFPSRGERIAVAAAGIVVELALASFALFAWLLLEPGLLRAACWNVMLIGSISTLLVNGNPLLRFDGYYVLQDAIDVPNLGSRANRALAYLIERHAFDVESSRSPASAPGEMKWLVGYGIAAGIWRFVVLFAMALLVAERLPGVGLALAALACVTQIAWPLLRGLRHLATSPRLASRRPRALAVTAALACGLGLGLFALPLPLHTHATGVIWPPEHSQVRAAADGFVRRVLVAPGSRVEAGQPLIQTEDVLLEARVALLEARLAEVEARREAAARGDERVRAELLEEEAGAARAELARARERAGDALIRAPAAGTFWLAEPRDPTDTRLQQGEHIGFVTNENALRARVVVAQSDVALVAGRTEGVALRLAERPGETLAASMLRQVPGAATSLPSAALGRPAGGPIAVDPADPEGRRALEPVFEFELALPEGVVVTGLGGRVHVRFAHGSEPVGLRALRTLRRTLLGRLGV